MAEILKNITLTVSGVVVFGSLCEMIIPDGTYKKYIRLSIGIMLICAVLTPFVNGKTDFEIDISKPERIDLQKYSGVDERAEIIRVYNKKISEKMYDDIKDTAGTKISLSCDIYTDDKNFGKIQNVYIAAENNAKVSEKAIDIIKEKYSAENVIIKYLQ